MDHPQLKKCEARKKQKKEGGELLLILNSFGFDFMKQWMSRHISQRTKLE